MTTTTTTETTPCNLRSEQATGLALIETICNQRGVDPNHRDYVLSLARKFPGIAGVMETIIRRRYPRISPSRFRISIHVQTADKGLMSQKGELCDGISSSIEDPLNHPGMGGWRCEAFFACDKNDGRWIGFIGALEPLEQEREIRSVGSIVAQSGEYMSYIIGVTTTGWWNRCDGRTEFPEIIDFAFTVYLKPRAGFAKLISNWSSDSLRLHFNARDIDGLQDQIRRGTTALDPNIRSAIQILLPTVEEFETGTLNGFAEALGLDAHDSKSSTGTLGDIHYRFRSHPVRASHNQADFDDHPMAGISQAMEKKPATSWNVYLEFWRDTPNGNCKIGFYYNCGRNSGWTNHIARQLLFDTIYATVNGAEELLGDINRRWAERNNIPCLRTKRATPMRHYNDKGGFCSFWASRDNLVTAIEVSGDLLKTLSFLLAEIEEGDWVLLVEEHYYNTPDIGEGHRLLAGRCPEGCKTTFDLSRALHNGSVAGVQLPL